MFKREIEAGGQIGYEPQMINAGGMTDQVWIFQTDFIAEMVEAGEDGLLPWGFLRVQSVPSHTLLMPAPFSLKPMDVLQDGPNGRFWKNSIVFETPKDDISIAAFASLRFEKEFVVITRDSNGLSKVYGTLEYPLKMEVLEKDPGVTGGANKYRWTFGAETLKPAGILPFDVLQMGYMFYDSGVWLSAQNRVFTDDFELAFDDIVECNLILTV
jgi:hypothetical protein